MQVAGWPGAPRVTRRPAPRLPLTFDPLTGIFSWTPSEEQQETHTATVMATDDGVPPLSAREMITITVIGVTHAPMLSDVELLEGQFRFRWSAQAGKTYRVQAKNDLEEPNWTDVEDILAIGDTAEFSNLMTGSNARYYRIQVAE